MRSLVRGCQRGSGERANPPASGSDSAWTTASTAKSVSDWLVTRPDDESLSVPLFADGRQESFVTRLADFHNAIRHATYQTSILTNGLRRRLESAVDEEARSRLVNGSLDADSILIQRGRQHSGYGDRELIGRLKAELPFQPGARVYMCETPAKRGSATWHTSWRERCAMKSTAATINTSAYGSLVPAVKTTKAMDFRRKTTNSRTLSHTAPAALASLV